MRRLKISQQVAPCAQTFTLHPFAPLFFFSGGSKGKKLSKNEQTGHTLQNLIKMLVQKGNDPIIVFAFSRKECEQYASQLTKLDLCNETEKALVTQVFNSAMDALSPDDKQLPQVAYRHSFFFFF